MEQKVSPHKEYKTSLRVIEIVLNQQTTWGKHMARPAQIRAAAKKIYTNQLSQARREARNANQSM